MKHPRHERTPSGAGLFNLYSACFCWCVFLVGLTWLVGFESIYGHPTPFYALLLPAFRFVATPVLAVAMMLALYLVLRTLLARQKRLPWKRAILCALLFLLAAAAYAAQVKEPSLSPRLFLSEFRWHVPPILGFTTAAVALWLFLPRLKWLRPSLDRRGRIWLLLGITLFYIAFALSIAALRQGHQGISQAFARQTLEVVGDVGMAPSMWAFVERYVELQPTLSLHGRVHPPGPALMVWAFGYVVGPGAFALSIMTVLFGSLAIPALYLWVRELWGARAGFTACMLYAVMPAPVLFLATSADALFPPFTLMTLYLFERSMRRGAIGAGLAAGLGYAAMSLLKYSLFGVGAYFAFAAIAYLRREGGTWRPAAMVKQPAFRRVLITAAAMLGVLLLVHGLLRWSAGFDLLESMRIAKHFVDHDRYYESLHAPRAGFWAWRVLNPLAWLYFAGIPIAALFFWRLLRPAAPSEHAPTEPHADVGKGVVFALALTALVQSLLYLGAGEGERSALYVMPFLLLPAAHLLLELGQRARPFRGQLIATLIFLAWQCWFTETLLYTYW